MSKSLKRPLTKQQKRDRSAQRLEAAELKKAKSRRSNWDAEQARIRKRQANSPKNQYSKALRNMSLSELRALAIEVDTQGSKKSRLWKLNAIRTEISSRISLGEDSKPSQEVGSIHESGSKQRPAQRQKHLTSEVDDVEDNVKSKGKPNPKSRLKPITKRGRVQLPDGLSREDLLQAIQELKTTGTPGGYGPSTFYDVLHEGERFPPKPIVGIAATNITGFNYIGDNFTGGLKSRCFKILTDNGFDVVKKSGESVVNDIEVAHSTDKWSDEEIQAAIEVYVEMMAKSSANEHFTKREYYENLTEQFGRTTKAFEFRMQNISAVLNELGRHWLKGLPPAKNVGTEVAKRTIRLLEQVEGQRLPGNVEFHIEVEQYREKPLRTKPAGNEKPRRSNTVVTQYERSPHVTAWVLTKSNGNCESCQQPAPFTKTDGSAYLEVHHVRRLADGGSDTTKNAVALCPNCHMELHYGENKVEKANSLYGRIKRLVRE